ncbi:MAG: hypothetical protein ACOZE7_10835 [Pseudomonadota bacterium]
MKKTDLAKSLGLKVAGQMRQAGSPGRFGQASSQVPDRREQRKLDQAAGLVPFAAKLHADLIKELQMLAAASGQSLNDVADRVIRAGLKQEKPGKVSKASKAEQVQVPDTADVAETAEKPAKPAAKPRKPTKPAKET